MSPAAAEGWLRTGTNKAPGEARQGGCDGKESCPQCPPLSTATQLSHCHLPLPLRHSGPPSSQVQKEGSGAKSTQTPRSSPKLLGGGRGEFSLEFTLSPASPERIKHGRPRAAPHPGSGQKGIWGCQLTFASAALPAPAAPFLFSRCPAPGAPVWRALKRKPALRPGQHTRFHLLPVPERETL